MTRPGRFPVIVDAIMVKVRDGQVAKPARLRVIAVTVDGHNDDLRPPEVAANMWSHTIVQSRVVHLIRNTFPLVARQDWLP